MTDNRPFLADLVLNECVVETNLKFLLKIEKESLLKTLKCTLVTKTFAKMDYDGLSKLLDLNAMTSTEGA